MDLMEYYDKNSRDIDAEWHEKCFSSGGDAWDNRQHYNSDKAFWEFVENYYEDNRVLSKLEKALK